MPSLAQQIKGLQQDIDDIIAGYYTPPTALGPNTLSKNSVKAKTIRSGNIDVTNLESVQTKTGSLTVDGNLTIGTGGSLRSGKTSYADTSNAGFWMGIDSSVAVIRIGNIGHTSGMVWDGTTLAITGTVTATSGTIGGWTISSTDLSADSGAIGMASSGSVRFWSGHTTPSSAPFQVSSAGALTATSGSVGGWTIDSSGIRLGSGATARGIDTGSTAFYAGSATPSSAPFRVTTAGVLTATGATIGGTITSSAITASSLSITGTANFSGGSLTLPGGGQITSSALDMNSGTMSGLTIDGTLTIGSGGKIQWNSTGSYIDDNEVVLSSSSSNFIKFYTSGSQKGILQINANAFFMQSMNNSAGLYLSSDNANLNLVSTAGGFGVSSGSSVMAHYTAGSALYCYSDGSVAAHLGDTAGSDSFKIYDSGVTNKFLVASNGAVGIYANSTTGIATGYTTLGTLIGRWAIHNASGTLVGYIPVYDTIT